MRHCTDSSGYVAPYRQIPRSPLTLIVQPYGRILEITPPSPVPAGTLRSAQISFRHIRSATSARNTIHALKVPASSSTTLLRTSYAQPIAAHAVRDYIANHPKIFLPVLFFLLGTVTYAVRTLSPWCWIPSLKLRRYLIRSACSWWKEK